MEKMYPPIVLFFLIVQVAVAQNTSPTVGNFTLYQYNQLEFGQGLTKEVNAGKIAYQNFSDGLDIVGAGTTATNRKIRFHAEAGSSFTGNVGIGTATPQTKLQVVGGIGDSNSGLVIINSADANASLRFGVNTNYSWMQSHGSTPLRINELGNNTLLNATNGNVGIGTTNPAYKLDVAGTINATNILVNGQPLAGGGSSQWAVNGSNISYAAGNVGIGVTNPAYKLDVVGTINATTILINGQPLAGGGSSQWATNGNNISYAAGNVGIGTTSPSAKLNVYNSNNKTEVIIGNPSTATGGFTSLLMGTSADTNGFGYIEAVKSSGSAYGDVVISRWGGNVGVGTTAPDGFQVNSPLANENAQSASNIRIGLLGSTPRIILDKAGSVPFEIDNAGGQLRIFNPGAVRLVVNSNGYVGIGTASPDEALAVRGKIHTNEVRVDLLGAVAPDYVFEPTYYLKPLAEIETYIKENKHLPEVPSAKEMEKNGVQLGEMNMLLLKKVEELTLYLLEQNKTLKEQAKTIVDQNARIIHLENKLK